MNYFGINATDDKDNLYKVNPFAGKFLQKMPFFMFIQFVWLSKR